MTRRKRKTKKDQRKRKSQKARERKRRKSSLQARAIDSRKVIEDMLPLFSAPGDDLALSGHAMEELMTAVIASEGIADEPEFEGALIDPLLCAETVARVGEEMGFTPETSGDLPEEERGITRMQVLNESLRRLLTEEWCQDVLKGLNDLRLRLRRSGEKEKTAQVAVLQSFLRNDKSRATWPTMGLVQAIFHRSVAAGFEMIEASTEMMGTGAIENLQASLIDRLTRSSLAQKVDRALKKVPGLEKYLEKQADKMWKEGLAAIRAGSLYLGLYSLEELTGAIEILATQMGYNSAEEMMATDLPSLEIPKTVAKTYLVHLRSYIAELFTPARLDQLRSRIDAALRDSAHKGKWLPFIVMLREYLQHEDAVENELAFLISALFSEMHAASTTATENAN